MVYTLDNQANTYGKGIELAAQLFTLLNGKVNPKFPARCLLFGPVSDESGDYGISAGDIIQLDMHKILGAIQRFRDEVSAEERLAAYKGLILYCVVHELLHLEQDLEYYNRISPDRGTAEALVEESCHCRTVEFLKLYNLSNMLGFDVGTAFQYARPLLSYFLPWEETDTDRYEQMVRSYYPICNPCTKALWYVNAYAFGRATLDRSDEDSVFRYPNDGYHSIYVTVKIGNREVAWGYLSYMGQWVGSSEMMQLVDPIILLSVQGFNMRNHLSQFVSPEKYPGLVWVNIQVPDVPEAAIQIVSQLPSYQQPIPPIL